MDKKGYSMDYLWESLKYFKPSEFRYPDEMIKRFYFLQRLDEFREFVGKPIIIHSDYRPNDRGQHGLGRAVDIHIVGMNIIDQFLCAEKSGLFSGIGVYPCWNNPGLHLDVRNLGENEYPARWGCWTPTGDSKKNIYVPLDSAFFKRIVMEDER